MVSVQIITPPEDEYVKDGENDLSLIVRIEYKDISFLFPGDASLSEQKDIMDKMKRTEIDSDVLLVAHHGAKEESETRFITQVNPQYAIISVGNKNQHHHPDKYTLDILQSKCNKVMRTDVDKTILCMCNGKEIIFETAIDIYQ